MKQFVVPISWNDFFKRILEDIIKNPVLLQALYPIQDLFYEEDVSYKEISNPTVQSNQIKILLHQILTHAIFEYSPCKDLLNLFTKKSKPAAEQWTQHKDIDNLLKLSAEPFQYVSKFFSIFFITGF